jgi:hypothetical protein
VATPGESGCSSPPRAIHDRSLEAYGLPPLPPEVRAAQADGDRRAAGCQLPAVAILAPSRTIGGFAAAR